MLSEKQLAEIESKAQTGTVLDLLTEVRRLRAVLEQYADRDNWDRSSASYPSHDLWVKYEHGYTRAEECLREDGE